MVTFPYYSQIFRDSYGNSMGNLPLLGVPCPRGSLKIPLVGADGKEARVSEILSEGRDSAPVNLAAVSELLGVFH